MQVLSTLRASLHFVNPTDPRLAGECLSCVCLCVLFKQQVHSHRSHGLITATTHALELQTANCRSHFLNVWLCAVPDRRQKGPMHPTARAPEALLVRELVGALQGNTAAATACLKLQDNMQGMSGTIGGGVVEWTRMAG